MNSSKDMRAFSTLTQLPLLSESPDAKSRCLSLQIAGLNLINKG